MTDPGGRIFYRGGKGGLDHDFVRLEGSLRMPVTRLMQLHLIASLCMLPLSFLAFRYRNFIVAFVQRLLKSYT